jgi:hypothetical protein
MPQNAEDLTTLFVIAERNVRQVWHDNEWFFSVVDVIAALTESADPRRYWSV